MWIPLVIAAHKNNKGGWWYQREIKDGDRWEQADMSEKRFQEWLSWEDVKCYKVDESKD